jgi:inorganic pyrophosphatase
MKNSFLQLKPFAKEDKSLLNAIIETPKGSHFKYAYDFAHGLFKLSKTLPGEMQFPVNFGFIPSTHAEDGDPLDVLVLNKHPLVCGCLVWVRLIAVMILEQQQQGKWLRNDRIIGEAVGKELPRKFRGLKLDPKTASSLEKFFVAYNKHYGRKIRVLGISGPRQACSLIEKAAKRYRLAR